jgi:hypothetical protein
MKFPTCMVCASCAVRVVQDAVDPLDDVPGNAGSSPAVIRTSRSAQAETTIEARHVDGQGSRSLIYVLRTDPSLFGDPQQRKDFSFRGDLGGILLFVSNPVNSDLSNSQNSSAKAFDVNPSFDFALD